jgi:hypothetical protein
MTRNDGNSRSECGTKPDEVPHRDGGAGPVARMTRNLSPSGGDQDLGGLALGCGGSQADLAIAAMRVGAANEAYARTRADERNFLAGELPFVITIERVEFPPAGRA